MTNTPAVLKGVIHGKTIELEQQPGWPDGLEVSVVIQPLQPVEGIRRSAGAWSEDAEGLEQFLEWNRRQRKLGRRELPEGAFSSTPTSARPT